MKKYLLIKAFAATLVVITTLGYLSIASTTGTRLLLLAINKAYLPELQIQRITGKLSSQVTLHNLQYSHDNCNITIQRLTIKPILQAVLSKQLKLPLVQVENLTLNAKSYPTLSIKNFQGACEYNFATQDFNLSTANLTGSWQNQPLLASINISKANGQIIVPAINKISIGENNLVITPDANRLNLAASITNLQDIKPTLSGSITATSSLSTNLTANEPINAIIKASNCKIYNQQIKQATIKVTGTTHKHVIRSTINMPNVLVSATTQGTLTTDYWSSNTSIVLNNHTKNPINITSKITKKEVLMQLAATRLPLALLNQYLPTTLSGNISTKLLIKKHAAKPLYVKQTVQLFPSDAIVRNHGNNYKIAINQGSAELLLQNNKLSLATNLAKDNNYLNLQASITNITSPKPKQKLSGEITGQTEDISMIMQFVPQIARLKGKITGTANLAGSMTRPIVKTNVAITNVTATFPEYGVKVKPLNLTISSENGKRFSLIGNGSMRKTAGQFNIQGYIEPFSKNMPNELIIYGENIECINTEVYQVTTTPDLHFKWLGNNKISLTGHLAIPKATINFNNITKSAITKSADVVFLDQPTYQSSPLQIQPDLHVQIAPNALVLANDFTATLGGNLRINTDQNNNLMGNGRITIKTGTYKVSGQNLQVTKGRFLYPAGTLLNNPHLDITLAPNESNTNNNLRIEGTLSDPIIHDNGMLNEQQALLQLIHFGSHGITNVIQNTFHLQELGFQEDNNFSSQFKASSQDNSFLNNQNFVVGKKINKKIYVQYLKSLKDANNTVRFKYTLGKYLALGVDTSNQGNGADLIFSIEK